jgi:hypothetical protein
MFTHIRGWKDGKLIAYSTVNEFSYTISTPDQQHIVVKSAFAEMAIAASESGRRGSLACALLLNAESKSFFS